MGACLNFTHLSPRNKARPTIAVSVANGATFIALDMTTDEKRKATSVLYLHVNRHNRKCYVGITIMPAGSRWAQGTAYRNNRRFGSAIKRYGWESFESYILAFADDRDALNKAEVEAILAAGGHKSKFTYNLSPGGDLVAENDKPVIGVNLKTGEERRFKSGAEASRQLGWENVDRAMEVARGEKTSTAGWWFRHEDDKAARPPDEWGEALRMAAVRRAQGKRIVAINYTSGESRVFDTTADAAHALGVQQSTVSMIARGEALSAKDWWFKIDGDKRELPMLRGPKATRAKRDKNIYAVHLKTGERREFRNCTVADQELGIYKGGAASVASSQRVSANDWWFSYDKDAEPPTEFKGALVAKARSKAVVATNISTGAEQIFASAKAAAEALGMSRSLICQIIGGKKIAGKGYAFRFA